MFTKWKVGASVLTAVLALSFISVKAQDAYFGAPTAQPIFDQAPVQYQAPAMTGTYPAPPQPFASQPPSDGQMMPPPMPGQMPSQYGGDGRGQEQERNDDMWKKQQEQREEMQKRQEEMQKKNEERAREQMKSGAKQFEKSIASIRKKVASYKTKGVTIPTSLIELIAKADSLIATVKTSTDFEEVQDAMGEFQDIGQAFGDELPKLEMALQFPKILKQVEKEYARLKRAVDTQRKKLSAVAVDLSASISELDAKVAGIRSAVDAAKSVVAQGGDASEAIESIQEDAFSQFEEAWQLYGSLEAVKSIKATLTKVKAQVKANDRILAKLKRDASPDLAELTDLQNKFKAQLAVVVEQSTGKDLDSLFEELQTLGDIQNDFENVLMQSQDDGDATNDTLSVKNNFGVPKFGPPSGLPGSSATDLNSLPSMRNMAPFMPNFQQPQMQQAPQMPQRPQ